MILFWLILIPLIGGALAWGVEKWNVLFTRCLALLSMVLTFSMVLYLWLRFGMLALTRDSWYLHLRLSWIPSLGISFHLAVDGISILLLLLTALLGILSILASWKSIQARVGLFHFFLLLTLASIMGLFLAVDLFLFYICWEVMIIPLYFLIDIWGHEQRHYAAIKFFIFTQTGGLFLLLAILGFFFAHGNTTGVYSFDYFTLLHTRLAPGLAFWLMLGFLLAFLVKLPSVPLHNWLPDAHTQAPVAGSVVLAGLVLKVGAYGLLRFIFPLFPQQAVAIAPLVMLLAVVSIIYGAVLAFAQSDMKRLVAYTSVSHMGFVLLGIFVWNITTLQGVILILLAHGVSTGALFLLAGMAQERLETREMGGLGGLWALFPKMGNAWLFFALATLGLPGLANFVGEFLVLLGTFRDNPLFACFAAVGFILSLIYALWMVQRIFFGPLRSEKPLLGQDLSAREMVIVAITIGINLWLGLAPQKVLDTSAPAISNLQQTILGERAISHATEVDVERGEAR